MSVTSSIPLPAAGDVRQCSVTVSDAPDAVVRVLAMLRRRGCVIRAVDFARGDHHRPGRLVIGLQPPPRHGHCIAPWLENLVDVLHVDVAEP
jgi:acetolactate synthase regulatory subunit